MAALGREHAGQRAAALRHAAPAGAARTIALMRQRAQELHRKAAGQMCGAVHQSGAISSCTVVLTTAA